MIQTPRRFGRVLSAAGGFALIAALLVAGSPASAASGDEHLAGLNYVALGDSYAAGLGLPQFTGTPVFGCAQTLANYPHQVALELGLDLTDRTCSGAATVNLTTTPQVTVSGTAPVQDASLSATTDIVTVTIGGNDLGFTDVMTFCAALSATGPVLGDPAAPFSLANCAAYFAPSPGVDLLKAKILGPVTTALNAVFADIAAKAPNAKVFVVGYPALTPAVVPTPDGCFSPVSLNLFQQPPVFLPDAYPYTALDVPYLHGIETLFDTTLSTIATAHNATMIPLFADTAVHSPCAAPVDAYVNGITVTSLSLQAPVSVTLEPGALHPNAAGAEFQTLRVEAAIRAAFPPPPEPSTTPAGNELAETGSNAGGLLALTGMLLLLAGSVAFGRARALARR